MYQTELTLKTQGRGLINITENVKKAIKLNGPETGICNIFIKHTSASLIISENADPSVREDLENYMTRLVKDGDPLFKHCAEGKDDMSAHIRTLLTETSLMIPIQKGRLALGIWQGIYLWEHRYHPHNRQILITVLSS